MDIIVYFQNRFNVPPFVINSMPKAGTNLLAKAVSLFPAIYWKRGYIIGDGDLIQLGRSLISRDARRKVHIGYSALEVLTKTADSDDSKVQVGIDRPRAVPINTLRNIFRRISNGTFVTGHLPHSASLADLYKETGVHALLILRDPRDVVISHANYVSKNPNHFLFATYQELTKFEGIMKSIVGIIGESHKNPKLLNIDQRYRSVLPWQSFDWNYTTYFEKLVGPKGSGTYQDQIEELEKIANHLNIKHSSGDIYRIADELHGGTATFHKGKIGNWSDHFSEEHKQVFKDITGNLLTELGYENNNDW